MTGTNNILTSVLTIISTEEAVYKVHNFLVPNELLLLTFALHSPLNLLFFFLQGEVPPDQDVVEYIMNQPNVVPRINSRILTAERDYLDLTASSKEHFRTNLTLFLTCASESLHFSDFNIPIIFCSVQRIAQDCEKILCVNSLHL